MKTVGPQATLKTLKESHFYILSTLPVSLDGEEALPLLLTDKAGVFTRDGKKVGFYSPEERVEALNHHRAFTKQLTPIIEVDGNVYQIGGEKKDPAVKVLDVAADTIFVMNNWSVTRFIKDLGYGEEMLIEALTKMKTSLQVMEEKLNQRYRQAVEGEALDEATLARSTMKTEMEKTMSALWYYLTGTAVPEIVKQLKDGKIDALAGVMDFMGMVREEPKSDEVVEAAA